MKEITSFTIEKDLKNKLKSIAKDQRRSLTFVICEAIEEYVLKNSKS